MPDPAAWQAFGGVAGVVIFLGGLVFALKRLGIIGQPAAPAPAPAPTVQPAGCSTVQADLVERVHKLERELDAHKLHVAENYVRQDDYIPATSHVVGLLEKHSVILARLEERMENRS